MRRLSKENIKTENAKKNRNDTYTMKKIKIEHSNYCVCCGEEIPEGTQTCICCRQKYGLL